jgi:glutamate--cysteine ligase/energy-coupling factor transport system ATP-binding protein
MELLKTIKTNQLVKPFLNGNFGLEKEGLRANYPATLATTMHPESLGDREVNPHIKTDYGEAQPEIVTPPLAPFTNAHNWLETISSVLISSLPDDEYMWPFSVPCVLPEADLIQTSATTNPELIDYRLYTASKYGKKRQLITGIHINYSFDQDFINGLFAVQDDFKTVEELRNHLYLKLASNFLRYQWLLVYLFGATPMAEMDFFDGPFFEGKALPTEPMRSLRNSKYGFTNDPKVTVRYDTVEHYAGDLQAAVATGLLRKEREYYGAIRLRGVVKDTDSLLDKGIQYLEVRSFDNDPFQVSGLSKETLRFIHLFFLTMLSLPEKVSPFETEKGNQLTKVVASEHPLAETKMRPEGEWLLEQMHHVIEMLDLSNQYSELVTAAFEQLNRPEKTVAGRIILKMEAGYSLLELGEELGDTHKQNILNAQSLPGFEHLDIEHQQHLVSILQLGLDVPLEYIQEVHLEN